LSEDALHSVPNGLREGAYALGSTRMQTSLRVVVPAAFSGISAAAILAVSRAIGETMIVAIAAGQQPRLTFDPRVPVETMTAYIVQVSLGDTPAGTIEYPDDLRGRHAALRQHVRAQSRLDLAAQPLPRSTRSAHGMR
jgi:phosphate transport system permease protein